MAAASHSWPPPLDHEIMGVTKLNDSLYDLGSCVPGTENLVVVFFHGLELDDNANPEDTYLRTWTFSDNTEACWPSQMLNMRTDPHLQVSGSEIVIRAYATRYDASKYTTNTRGRLDLFLIGENLLQMAIHPIMKQCQSQMPIVLVAHSFGGIVIRDVIDKAFQARKTDSLAKNFLTSLSGIFFFSTPHKALKKDVYQAIFKGQIAETSGLLTQFNKKLVRETKQFEENMRTITRLEDLRNNKEIKITSAFETHQTTLEGWTGAILEEASARIGYNITFIEADHFEVCKPSVGPSGLLQNKYSLLRDFIVDVFTSERLSQGEAVRI